MILTFIPIRAQGADHFPLVLAAIALLATLVTPPALGETSGYYDLPDLGGVPLYTPVNKWLIAAADGSPAASDTGEVDDKQAAASEQAKIAEALNSPTFGSCSRRMTPSGGREMPWMT